MRRALQIITVLGLGGLIFSGYLTYGELLAAAPVEACTPLGQPGTVLGYPPCIYGFVMYLAIVVVAGIGLWKGREGTPSHAGPSQVHAVPR